jgi:uncharacterized protein (TIGR00255 family)
MSRTTLKSMTGYARASASSERYEVVAEVRSVNHRYLEVRVRVSGSSGLQTLEKRVRDQVGKIVGRGKVDVSLHVKPKGESAFAIEVDVPLLEDFANRVREAGRACGIEGELTLTDLAAFSPAFQVREKITGDDSPIADVVERALALALEAFDLMRASEGQELAADFEIRLKALGSHLDSIEKWSESSRAAKRVELQAKVEELLSGPIESAAIAAEVARLVERADVAEEVTRFRSHMTLWASAVDGSEPSGKKLDFIVQEMNREVNTIGSKCQDARITESVIAMKSEIERVREQVQNVE